MHKTKIIYLSPVGFFKGGAERSLFDLVDNPAVEAIMLAPEDDTILEKARSLGLAHEVLPFGSINTIHRPFSFMKGFRAVNDLLKAALKLKAISKETGANIVHSNGLKAHMINCVSSRLGGAKSVLHIRDIPYTKPEILIWKIMHTLCYKMILVSHACWPADALPRKAVVIHNGTPLVDIDRGQNNKDSNDMTIGFVGRIHPGKGLHLLVDWLAAARGKGMDVRLSVRGTFSEDAPTYEDEIKAQIETLGMGDYVEFTGFIHDAQTLYRGLNVVVVPSKAPDPLPRSVMESMARGIPVFGYPAGGIFEMIEDGKTGYLVDSAQSFVASLEKVSGDQAVLDNMMQAAREKIEREFTIEGLHQGVSDIYTSLS